MGEHTRQEREAWVREKHWGNNGATLKAGNHSKKITSGRFYVNVRAGCGDAVASWALSG